MMTHYSENSFIFSLLGLLLIRSRVGGACGRTSPTLLSMSWSDHAASFFGSNFGTTNCRMSL